jgi:hypothetical protein
VEDFLKRLHRAIRQYSIRLNEEIAHLALPSIIHFTSCHARPRSFEILGFQISDQKAVFTQK